MTAPAFMSFYVGDYLRDTMHLNRDQHGAYLLLIFACWTNNGKLQNNDKVLASIAKATDDEWKTLKPLMRKFFKISSRFWISKRVGRELQKAEKIRQVRQKAGKTGAAKRWQKPSSRARDSTATATTMKTPPSTTPLPIGAAPDERRRPTRLPVDWQPDAADRDFAGELGLNAGEVAAEFRDYWSAIAGRKATRLDWHATFRNACRLYASRYRGGNGHQRPGNHRQAGASFTAAIRRAFAEARDEGMA